jgi:hypothetical protein
MTPSLFDDHTVRDLVHRLGTLTPDRRPLWGRMSAGAMVCHLIDYVNVALGTTSAPRAVPRWLQPVVRVALLHWRGPYPRNARTLPELLVTVPSDFEEDRRRLVRAIETFASRSTHADWPPSPIAGPLTGAQWARIAHDHVAHHFRQFEI